MYEYNYKELVKRILKTGEIRYGRNGITKAIFPGVLSFVVNYNFPLLTSRQIFYKGVLGELAAILRGPKHLRDFEQFGCNYWKLWAKDDGSINVDYGNAWIDFNGVDQLERLREGLRTNPYDRRHLVSGWRPDNLWHLDLPCCHYAYQFYIREGRYLDMLWHQRSTDVMIGLPSDMVLAATWLIILANDVGYLPGKVTMTLGDTHIYEEHLDQAKEYVETLQSESPTYKLLVAEGKDFREFTPDWLEIKDYNPVSKINFELKA